MFAIRMTELDQHQQSANVFYCDICGMECCSKSHIMTHMRIHTTEEKYGTDQSHDTMTASTSTCVPDNALIRPGCMLFSCRCHFIIIIRMIHCAVHQLNVMCV